MCSKFPTFLNQKAILVCHSFNPSKKIPAKECPLTEEKKSWELLIADAHTKPGFPGTRYNGKKE
jgi:hypothetical protein